MTGAVWDALGHVVGMTVGLAVAIVLVCAAVGAGVLVIAACHRVACAVAAAGERQRWRVSEETCERLRGGDRDAA